MAGELIELNSPVISATLKILLKDKTTRRNIIWATNSYESYGEQYREREEITICSLKGLNSIDIQPRVYKTLEAQKNRTKKRAEVFTPSWLCNQMNNQCDDIWFGRKEVFNVQNGKQWRAKTGKIRFLKDVKKRDWTDYVYSKRIEITCGEAPFLVSRYDTTTGEIIPVSKRIGVLDRKLRVVNENTSTEEEWFRWVVNAYKSVYGYEFQGDNLLIARINLLLTFVDFLNHKWHKEPKVDELRTIAHIVAWNVWQMDGLTYQVPLGGIEERFKQECLFEEYEYEKESAAYGIVKTAIEKHDKTITLAVQRLTTGVTIPEWTAVFILSEMKSEQTYMQAAFRAQNPCVFEKKGKFYRKTDSYVFDFNPERSLSIIEKFANDLYSNTAEGRGTYEDRKNNITELLKYLPVVGEDEDGTFHDLTAEEVLSIPRTIRSTEVVRRGFMCNFLFADDFSGIFRAPTVVTKILNQLTVPKDSIKKKNTPIDIVSTAKEDLHLNKDGLIEITKDEAIKNADENIVTKKALEETAKKVMFTLPVVSYIETDIEKEAKKQKTEVQNYSNKIAGELLTKSKSGMDVSKAIENKIKTSVLHNVEKVVQNVVTDKNIEKAKVEKEIKESFSDCSQKEINDLIIDEHQKIEKKYQGVLETKILEATEKSRIDCSTILMTDKCEKEKSSKEDEIREHLKGFARTIPSFLMAYGTDDTTLETFERDIPADVFKDVTSITIEEFVFLRDGGDREDENGEIVHFNGHVFEPVVFNDSVKEFLRKKQLLSNYFEKAQTEDIFDYIPPQKTNQIYTPKNVVKHMVDLLEDNNPGCFEQEDKTFIDLYMKSGLFIAEIVKRLYQSKRLTELYPNKEDRLKHIFEKQVYGLAPTEIIYRIALSFVLGFDKDVVIVKHNLKQYDVLPDAQAGTLEKKLDEIFKA